MKVSLIIFKVSSRKLYLITRQTSDWDCLALHFEREITMNSKTYISDPKMWEMFYKNMAEKKINPYKYRPIQKGRGWSYKKSYRIPVRPHSQIEIQPTVPLVTPVAALEERAKYQYNEEVKEGNPHYTPRLGIKRKAESSIAISNQKPKGSSSQKKITVSKIGKRFIANRQKIGKPPGKPVKQKWVID